MADTAAKEARIKLFLKIWDKLRPALPWLSVLYGVASGYAIERDFEQSQRLLTLAIGAIVCVLAVAIFEFVQRRDGAKWQKHMPNLLFAGHFLTQSCVQYVAMFVLPLTIFNRCWGHLILAALMAIIAMIDPWWQRASRWALFLPVMRALTAYFAMSFSMPALAPQYLSHFSSIVDITAIVLFIPWSRLELWWDMHWRRRLLWIALVSIPLDNLFIPFLPQPQLLSVWVKGQRFGFNITDHALTQQLDQIVAQPVLAQHLAAGDKLCCLTPIMGPLGLDPPIIHEWYLDGRLIDRISLGSVQGRQSMKEPGYRTYSCKGSFPELVAGSTLQCRVLLGAGAIIGSDSLHLTP